jgi:predicted O-methyltransferase YrrM
MIESKPNFDGVFGSPINALRFVYMMGAVWFLSNKFPNKKLAILEVGSWCGASALVWGEALERYAKSQGAVTCVDFWEPHHDTHANADVIYQEMDAAAESGEAYDVFLNNIGFLPEGVEIEIIRGDSKKVLPSLDNRRFDLIYIDGDHTYNGVNSDINNCLGLVNEGGILSGDDLEIQKHAIERPASTIDPALDLTKNPELGSNYHPGVTLAVEENFGPVSSWYGFWGMQKIDPGWQQFSLDGLPLNFPKFLPVEQLIKLKSLLHHPDLV